MQEQARAAGDGGIAERSGPQLVGICFGMQALSDALGGKVQRNCQFVVGADQLKPTPRYSFPNFSARFVCLCLVVLILLLVAKWQLWQQALCAVGVERGGP